MPSPSLRVLLPLLVAATPCASMLAAGPEVIFSEKPGHPTAAVPGAVGLDGLPIATEWKAMELFSVSPDGTTWIIKGRNHAGSDVETMLVLGGGTAGSVVAQEGQPVHGGEDGELYDFFGSGEPRFDSTNRYVYTARARGGDSAIKQKGIFFDGVSFSVVRTESAQAFGLSDLPPNPSGDEAFGNSFGSFHLLDDDRIGSHDTTIQNIHSSRRPAVFYDDQKFRQVNVDFVEGTSPAGGALWTDLASNQFYTTPDGSTYMILGEDDAGVGVDDIIVVNDLVVLRQGTSIGGVIPDGIFHVKLDASGSWFARGDDAADDDWAVADGTLVAKTGDAVVVGSEENWADVFLAFAGNGAGDWVLAGRTDGKDEAANEVLVLNGASILMREGDPIDLDGNGLFDDDAFIGRGNPTLGAFHANDLHLTDDGTVYVFVSLRDGAGNDLGSFGTGGDAFLRLSAAAPCPADLDGNEDVGFSDLVALLAAWGPCPPGPCPADLDGNEDVGFSDLVALLAAWGPCP